jgi:hypothetical protein
MLRFVAQTECKAIGEERVYTSLYTSYQAAHQHTAGTALMFSRHCLASRWKNSTNQSKLLGATGAWEECQVRAFQAPLEIDNGGLGDNEIGPIDSSFFCFGSPLI